MTFVDTSVFVYAVGGEHPLRREARRFFEDAIESGRGLTTSAEVLQELLHVYLPVRRMDTLDAALALVAATVIKVWAVEEADVRLARELAHEHPALSARDLVHLACSLRRDAQGIMTFDRRLKTAFRG